MCGQEWMLTCLSFANFSTLSFYVEFYFTWGILWKFLLPCSPPISKISQTIQEAIINNYTDCDFSLDSVYASIPYSKEYVRKIFIKEHGVSPLTYLMEKRIDCAKQLLLRRNNNDSNYSIKEIAEMCGFSDSLYFSRYFKKITGVPPKEYKLTILENNKISSP